MNRHWFLAMVAPVFVCMQAVQGSALAGPRHPLDDLDGAELGLVRKVLTEAGKITPESRFPYIVLREPVKGAPPKREALAVVYQPGGAGGEQGTYEAVVNLGPTARLESFTKLDKVQPAVMLSEFNEAPEIVRKDPRFQKALAKRGIDLSKDPNQVAIDIWSYGTPDTPLSKKARLLRAVVYLKKGGSNFYARPIDGLTILINMDHRRVEEIRDTEVYPLPSKSFEYSDRPTVAYKPLVTTQAQGPSFVQKGQEVTWGRWAFRYSMHPREGLVLRNVTYDGRSVLYRGSLSEMMVPYGHPDSHWTYRSAFDEGEYGIGRYSASLIRGADVPAHALLLPATFADDLGKPYTVKDVVAIYERDGGMLWRHYDMYENQRMGRRARLLVLGFITTISNYDYGLSWIFHEDGTLELSAELSGIMLAKGSHLEKMKMSGHDPANKAAGADDQKYAHLVAPNVVAPHHQHFFNMRLDLDVDGAGGNSVAELNTRPVPYGPKNPAGNAFSMEEAPLLTERAAVRDLSYDEQRKWKIENPGKTTDLGYHPSYLLVPGDNSAPYLAQESPLRIRGGFVNHPVWFTRYAPDELYAAGAYPSQNDKAEGLPKFISQDRSLVRTDVVLWYTFCVTHAPRPEEWPVMNAHRVGFRLMPAGFLSQNPSVAPKR